MYGVLPPPLELTGDFQKDIDFAYSYFEKELNDRNKRPTLFDKQVYIEAKEIIHDRPQGFWHIISLENTHRFKILPCVNDKCISLCNQNCIYAHHPVSIKYGFEVRNVCLLRASRLPWITEIIKLASRDDPSIKVWLKPGKGKQSSKLHLRYTNDGADYILIFSVEKYVYRLISAFPVFYTQDKADFDKDSKEFAWSYFDS